MDLLERPETAGRRHPWEVARADFFLRLFSQISPQYTQASWLDVGAGDGYVAARLRESVGAAPRIVCWDVNYPLTVLERPAVPLEFTVSPPDGRFDTILMLDVIEHVQDDRAFVADVVDRFLAPGGRVVVSVPAYMALFTSHDRDLKHFRRYSPRQGRKLLADCGLAVLAEGGLFHSLLPVRAGQALAEGFRRSSVQDTPVGVGQWKGGRLASTTLDRLLWADASASLFLGTRRIVAPGLSYWAVCSGAQGAQSSPGVGTGSLASIRLPSAPGAG